MRFVCNDCKTRFQLKIEPKFCPVCNSNNIKITTRQISQEEHIREFKKICNDEAKIILELRKQLKPHQEIYRNAYKYLAAMKSQGKCSMDDVTHIGH